MQEDAITWLQAAVVEERRSRLQPATDHPSIPVSCGEGLDETADASVQEHDLGELAATLWDGERREAGNRRP